MKKMAIVTGWFTAHAALVDGILHNPYHRCGAVIARIGVNSATLLWSLTVLFSDNALAPTPYGPLMIQFAPEDFYGWAFLGLSLINLYRIVRQSKPNPFGIVSYLILFLAWGFVWIIMIFFQRPMYPTAIGCVSVVAALAVYGFVANPRPRDANAR